MNLSSARAMQHFQQTSTLVANGARLLREESLCLGMCVIHRTLCVHTTATQLGPKVRHVCPQLASVLHSEPTQQIGFL